MKLTTLTVIAILAPTNLSAKHEKALAYTVQICADRPIEIARFSLGQEIAAEMFAGIGIRLQWLDPHHCPVGAIRISLSNDTPTTLLPGALAYSLPYEGTHIVLFFDRIQLMVERRLVPVLLAHVMAHEVTHILEGSDHHSEEGVMKAFWTQGDYDQMAWKPLFFAPEDIYLVHRSLEREREQTAEATAR